MIAPPTHMMTAKQMPTISLPLEETADGVAVGILCGDDKHGTFKSENRLMNVVTNSEKI